MENIIEFKEIWRQMPCYFDDFNDYYYISTYGRAYSKKSEKLLTSIITENGYMAISFNTKSGHRIQRRVHRLVMIAFSYFDGCGDFQVNHYDGNKFNNHISNLEWCTPLYNIRHAIANGLKPSFSGENNPFSIINENSAIMIKDMLISREYSDYIISDIIGCNVEIVRQIAYGKTWIYLFTDKEKELLKLTRCKSDIDVACRHAICKYYEHNISDIRPYGYIIELIKNSLISIGMDTSETNVQIARRLYYRYDNPEITQLYNY